MKEKKTISKAHYGTRWENTMVQDGHIIFFIIDVLHVLCNFHIPHSLKNVAYYYFSLFLYIKFLSDT